MNMILPLREANLPFSISSPPASPVRLALLGRRAGLRESNPPASRCEALRAGGGQAEIKNANKKIPRILTILSNKQKYQGPPLMALGKNIRDSIHVGAFRIL